MAEGLAKQQAPKTAPERFGRKIQCFKCTKAYERKWSLVQHLQDSHRLKEVSWREAVDQLFNGEVPALSLRDIRDYIPPKSPLQSSHADDNVTANIADVADVEERSDIIDSAGVPDSAINPFVEDENVMECSWRTDDVERESGGSDEEIENDDNENEDDDDDNENDSNDDDDPMLLLAACPVCTKRYRTTPEVEQHLAEKHGIGKVKSVATKKKRAVKDYARALLGNKTPCPEGCGAEFDKAGNVRRHLMNIHKKTWKGMDGFKIKQTQKLCPHCSKRFSNLPKHLKC